MNRCLDVHHWQLLWAFRLGLWPSLKGCYPPLLATPSLVSGHHHLGPYCSLSATPSLYQLLLLLGLLASWECHAHSYNTGLAKARSLSLSLSPSCLFLPPYYLYKLFTLVDRSQVLADASLFLSPAASVQQHSFPSSSLQSRWPASSSTAGTGFSGQPGERQTTPGPVPRSSHQEKFNPCSISTVFSLCLC